MNSVDVIEKMLKKISADAQVDGMDYIYWWESCDQLLHLFVACVLDEDPLAREVVKSLHRALKVVGFTTAHMLVKSYVEPLSAVDRKRVFVELGRPLN